MEDSLSAWPPWESWVKVLCWLQPGHLGSEPADSRPLSHYSFISNKQRSQTLVAYGPMFSLHASVSPAIKWDPTKGTWASFTPQVSQMGGARLQGTPSWDPWEGFNRCPQSMRATPVNQAKAVSTAGLGLRHTPAVSGSQHQQAPRGTARPMLDPGPDTMAAPHGDMDPSQGPTWEEPQGRDEARREWMPGLSKLPWHLL